MILRRIFRNLLAFAWRAACADLTLTRRQKQVAALVELGFTNKEIAGQLEISESTVKTHLKAVYHKLGIQRRRQLVRRMLQAVAAESPAAPPIDGQNRGRGGRPAGWR